MKDIPASAITLYDAETTRSCGDCSACCKLLPMPELNKPANQRCKYQKFHKGCTIYAHRPSSCQLWSCRWLTNSDTGDLPRPDRSHYVIDPIPDFVRVVDKATGELVQNVEVIQIWVDPDYPDAHRDPALRRYLARRGEENILALIRLSAKEAFTLVPPHMTGGEWREVRDGVVTKQNTFADFLAAQEENRALAAKRGGQDG